MTGRVGNILPISSITDPDVINTYFQSINTDPEYIAPQLQSIPKDTRIPSLSTDMGCNFLRKLKRTTSILETINLHIKMCIILPWP